MPGNVDKTMTAPVTAITGHDTKFYELLPWLFPHAEAKSWFVGNETFANDTAYKNGTLQVAYFIMALRALGLDAGPMSGFDITVGGLDSSSTFVAPCRRNLAPHARRLCMVLGRYHVA
jgi:hypothetical protein